MPKPLTPQQIARLGGFASARSMTPEQRSERARKAGQAAHDKYGTELHVRAALKRHGYAVKSVKQMEATS